MGKFVTRPRESHKRCVEQIISYLKGAKNLALKYSKTGKVQLTASSDSDWAGCPFTRYSRYGYVTWLAGGPLTWQSKLAKRSTLKRTTYVDRSTCEAEYFGLAECLCDLHYLANLLTEMGYPQDVIMVDEDNSAVLDVTQGRGRPSTMRHMDIDYRFVQDDYKSGFFSFNMVEGIENTADIFTKYKGYSEKLFKKFRDRLLRGRDE